MSTEVYKTYTKWKSMFYVCLQNRNRVCSLQQDMKTVQECLENIECKDFAGSRTESRTARHQGPVKKRGFLNPAYKQRFFVLTDDELCYFENERAYLENHKGGLRGSIPIIQVRVTRCTPKGVYASRHSTRY